MSTDDRMETITDPAAIRACDEPDERGDFPCCTTPAPASGAAVALDLDALHETICDKFTGMAEVRQAADLLVAEVRRLTESRATVAANLAASLMLAEAEVGTLRAQVNGLHEELLRDDPETVTLRARLAAVEAHASRLAASLALTLYDAHPVYGSTALWHGGVGGQAITAHCAIINGGPPGMEWAEGYLPSMALSEFIAATPGFDLDAAKAAMLADLRAALATTGEGQ